MTTSTAGTHWRTVDRTASPQDTRAIIPSLYYSAFALFFANHFLMCTCFYVGEWSSAPFSPPTLSLPDLIDIAVVVLLALKFVLWRPSLSGTLASSAIVAVGLLSWLLPVSPVHTGTSWLFWIAVFVATSEGVQMDYLMAISLPTAAILLVVTIICSKLGIIENLLYPRENGMRESVGFLHSNICGYYTVLICLSASAVSFTHGIHAKRATFGAVLAIYICMLVLNLTLSQSRSAMMVWLISLAAYAALFLVQSPRIRFGISLALLVGLAAGIFLSLYLMVAFDPVNDLHAHLDELLSGRPRLSHYFFEHNSVRLFGTSYADADADPVWWNYVGPQKFLVDNCYCRLLLGFGIVPSLLLLTGVLLLYWQLMVAIRRNENSDANTAILLGLAMAGFYGLTEKVGIRLEWNYFLIALGCNLMYSPASPLRHNVSTLEAYGMLPRRFRRFLRPLRRVLSGGGKQG